MNEAELLQLVAEGETRRTEFKAGGPLTDGHLLARIIRAVLAMSNTRDGGRVIIGVEEVGGQPQLAGVTPADLATWNVDDVTAKIAPYADPAIDLTLESVTSGTDTVVVLHVAEFSQVPTICKKGYDAQNPVRTVLKKGAVYVRGRPKPESVEVPDQNAMRELLDLATDKQLGKFVRQGIEAGVLSTLQPQAGSTPDDRERFLAERGSFG